MGSDSKSRFRVEFGSGLGQIRVQKKSGPVPKKVEFPLGFGVLGVTEPITNFLKAVWCDWNQVLPAIGRSDLKIISIFNLFITNHLPIKSSFGKKL